MIKSQFTHPPFSLDVLPKTIKQNDKVQTNLQVLKIEIYEIVNDVDPTIMKSLFQFHLNQYNLRNFQELSNASR